MIVFTQPEVRVETIDEDVLDTKSVAEVRVYSHGKLTACVYATIDHAKGADGGLYPIVVFRERLT